MNPNRKDIAERWRQLAERILQGEGAGDLESLKSEHIRIYEDLVRLGISEKEIHNAVEPPEPVSQETEPLDNPPEPLSEQDEIIVPEAEEETKTSEGDTKSEEALESGEALKSGEALLSEEVGNLEEAPESSETTHREAEIKPEEETQVETQGEHQEEKEYPTLSDLFVPTFNDIKEDMSQKEEFKDTVSLDETEKLFETRKEEIRQLSLNDRLVSSSIQIGLNDRIAFVNKLFNFSQSDFNKVLSRLNACTTRDEALHYVQYQVKTNYNWKGKEDLEERFISLIERKFMS